MATLAEGKVFVFTGKLAVTRNQASEAARKAGGFVGSSVSRNTDYLVVGEKPGSKEAKAIVLGIPRITEGELLNLLEELPEEELPMEKWNEYDIKVITEETFLKVLETLEAHVEEKKRSKTKYPPREEMSYTNMQVLDQLLTDHAGLNREINLQPILCRHCNNVIPYSIHKIHYYCFNCHCYEDVKVHICQWGPCLDLPSSPDSWYEECKVCENVRTVTKSKVAEKSEFVLKSDFVHSAEFAFDVTSKLAVRDKARYEHVLSGSFINDEKYNTFIQYLRKNGFSVRGNHDA